VTRWTRRLLLGAIAVLVPLLAGCEAGANAPTLDFHPASFGTSTTVSGITIDDAFVLGPAVDSSLPAGGEASVFLSLEAQNNDQLTKVTASRASSVQLVSGPVTLSPYTVVNLSGPQPQIVLTGLTSPLSGGQTVSLDLYFANAGEISITVPVLPASYEYATYSPPPAPTPTITPTPSATGSSASPSAPPAVSASPSPTSS
jgi:copper(I)-binding protein